MRQQNKNGEEKIKRNENAFYFQIFFKIRNHYFPKLISWMNNLEDFRTLEKCIYPIRYMIFMGLLLYILKLEALRQLHTLNGQTLIDNLNDFLGLNLEALNHFGTLIYFCKGNDPKNLETLRYKMIQSLLRKKVLTRYRLFNEYYLIAIDGTNNLTFKKRHCPQCIARKAPNGEIYYYHPVLEAKIVTSSGLAFSVESEFIENKKGVKKALSDEEKQDCELRAAYRLIEKLKKKFPQLKICLLADSLYANQQIMKKCKDYGWKYIITFKEGSIPNVYKEFESLIEIEKGNIKQIENEKVRQDIRWINHIDHEEQKVNVVECREHKIKEQTDKKFVFITNILITKKYVDYLVQTGRLRWKIENEGFNIQKNKGYNLEHKYSRDETAIKNLYLFMQIAHILNQLVEKSNLLKPYKDYYFKTVRNLSKRLIYELILVKINFDKIKKDPRYVILDPG